MKALLIGFFPALLVLHSVSAVCQETPSPDVTEQVKKWLKEADLNGNGKIDTQEERNKLAELVMKLQKTPDGSNYTGKSVAPLVEAKADDISNTYGDVSGNLNSNDLAKLASGSTPQSFVKREISPVVSLSESSDGSKAGSGPAKFSWTFADNTSYYAVDGALSVHPNVLTTYEELSNEWAMQVEPVLKLESHVTNQAKATQDSVAAQLPVTFIFNHPANDPNADSDLLQSQYLEGGPIYQSDKEFDLQTFGAQVSYTPSIPRYALGVRKPIAGDFGIEWRPTFGVHGGSVLEDTKHQSPSGSNFIRPFQKLHLELWYTNHFVIATDFANYISLTGHVKAYPFVEISPTFYFDEDQNIAVGVTYENGETEPKFQSVDTLSAWIGLKF